MDKISIRQVAERHRKLEIDSSIEACVILEIDGANNAELEKQAEAIRIIASEFEVVSKLVATSQQRR